MGDVLKNPHRLKILEILSQKRVASIKEIADTLGLSLPTVYYHLELLKGCVSKTARGEFEITEEGLRLYTESLKKRASPRSIAGAPFVYSFFSSAARRPSRFLPAALAVAALEYLICRALLFEPRLIGFSRSLQIEALPFAVPLNILIVFAILEAMAFAVTKRTGGELPLLNGVILSRVPLWLALIDPILGVNSSYFSIALLAVSQLISIYLLSASISLSKGIRQEVSIIMCLVLLYLNLLLGTF
ncbi:MAG: helix-turn-helix domain-containing protein [Candidatus Methanomethylicia archaeon]|nr:helix-turn-helix domain-containing protein [Candidatus Methanomethylicia archaeon]